MIASIIANRAAFKNPHTSNHSSRLLANNTINTVIIPLTNPRVIQFNGIVSTRSIHHTVQLNSHNTTATIIADQNQATSTPGSKYDAAATASHISTN